jgi:hypothetical protein
LTGKEENQGKTQMGIKKPEIISRRNFFKSLVGEIIINYDEAKGITNVPLNRLNELPEEMIREIIPVLFDDPRWRIQDGELFRFNDKENKYELYQKLTEHEAYIVSQFDRNKTLFVISMYLADVMKIELPDALAEVKDLFFQWVSLLICHPIQQYDFDKIVTRESN